MHDCSLLSLSQEFPARPLGQRPTSAQHPPGTGRGAPEGGATSLPWHRFRAKIIVHDSSSLCVPKCEGKRPFGRSGARQDEGVTALKPVLKQQVRMQTLASVWRNREWQYLFKTCLSGGMGGTKQNKTKKSWVYQRLGWKKLERPNSVSASAVQTVGSRWFPGLSGSWVTSLPGQYDHALGEKFSPLLIYRKDTHCTS